MVAQQERLTIQVGEVETQLTKRGSGEPLVYLHGAFGYQGWPSFLDRLAEHYTVYSPLLPGFGESDGLERIDDVLDLTLYHYDLLDALGLDAPSVVGFHLGGMVAAEMAALCPHRVGKLALVAPTGLWLDESPGVDYFATPMNELRGILFSDPGSPTAKGAMPDPESDDERGMQSIQRVRSLAAAGKFLWPIPDRGLKKRLGRIKSPALVVVGENDKIVPSAYGSEFSRRIPGSRLHIINGAGHLLFLEKPEEFAGLVTEFLNG